MSQDQQLTPDAMAALRDRFEQQSRKAQAYYAFMHEVRGVLGSDEAASAWMETPLAAFASETPARLVAAGSAQAVLDHLRSLQGAR